ncbi:hypothetical protein NW762_013681 [Fusarium torreyae]|uniref:EF-hand domain-containing protein n=1 Tax=Fusarium torreyae TaxID=1237075 RepID=A0A9W8RLY7_9HYPO|nr:hypothetical protein NW762_013681 [Fusarium torreyae]
MHFYLLSILSLLTLLSTSNALATGTRDLEQPGSYAPQTDTNHDGYLSPEEIQHAADLSRIYETHFKNAKAMGDVNLTLVVEDYYQIPLSEDEMSKLAVVAGTLRSGQMLADRSLSKRCSAAKCAQTCKPLFLIFTLCFLGCLPVSGSDCDK